MYSESHFLIFYKGGSREKIEAAQIQNASIVIVKLEPKDGMIKKTFGIAHYSWWRTKDFNVSQAKTV